MMTLYDLCVIKVEFPTQVFLSTRHHRLVSDTSRTSSSYMPAGICR